MQNAATPPATARIDPAAALAEPATDILRAGRRTLGAFFAPRAVALIGATDKPGSVGRTILTNLIASPFGGTVYPVNPKRRSVVGIAAVPSVGAIPEPVDLAVIVTPPPGIPAHHRGVRPGGHRRRDRHLGGLQGGRRRRARSSSARPWRPPGGTACGSSAPTAWA